MGSTAPVDRTVKGVEDLLIRSLQGHLNYEKFTVFGVVCVTCEGLEESLTIKLNKEILKDESTEKELHCSLTTKEQVGEDPLPIVKSAFRKRSFSADGNLPKIRTPQVRRLQSSRPSSTGVLLDDSSGRPSAFYKPPTPGARKYELPKSPLFHNGVLEKQGAHDSFDTAFKAVTTDKGQRELLEKTLKEFIKIKYHQSVSGKDSRTEPSPNPKISPMTTDFLKLLSLQARIMGIPLPASLDGTSKIEKASPRKTPGKSGSDNERNQSHVRKNVAVDSFSKDTSVSGALGITKHKKLSFIGSDKCRIEQGQFAKVMHDKLAGVKQFVPEDSDHLKKKNKATSPTRPDKMSAKSDKRKQVLKKQHALRVAKELKKDHVGDSSKVINDLPSVPQIEIKEEKPDDSYDAAGSSSVPSDFNENCLLKGVADISEMDIKLEADDDLSICFDVKERYGTINEGNNSIHLPPSAYVFKPIILNPKGRNGKEKNIGVVDSNSTEDDIDCVHRCNLDVDNMDSEEDISNQSTLSCPCDISTAEHSFVPRESLSSLQVEDEADTLPKEEDVEDTWKILPFADVESIPDEVQISHRPLQQKWSALKVTINRGHDKGAFQMISEDSNMSNISMESVGFDILTGCSPSKLSDCSLDGGKTQSFPKPLSEGHSVGNSLVHTEEAPQLHSNVAQNDKTQSPSQGFKRVSKRNSSLDDLAMTLSHFSPVKCDAKMTDTKTFPEEPCLGQDVSPIQHKGVAGSSNESHATGNTGMAHNTSTPKIHRHTPAQPHEDHNYTYKSKQAKGKVNKDKIRKRKPQNTKKFFPLVSYLASKKGVVGNIETELVTMDDVKVITLEETKQVVKALCKKRHMSGNSKACGSTPSKRMKCEEGRETTKSKPSIYRPNVVTTGKGTKKQGTKPTVAVASAKKPPARPPFRTVSNETILRQNKRNDLLVHQPTQQKELLMRINVTPKKSTTASSVAGSMRKTIKRCEKVKKGGTGMENKQKLKRVADRGNLVKDDKKAMDTLKHEQEVVDVRKKAMDTLTHEQEVVDVRKKAMDTSTHEQEAVDVRKKAMDTLTHEQEAVDVSTELNTVKHITEVQNCHHSGRSRKPSAETVHMSITEEIKVSLGDDTNEKYEEEKALEKIQTMISPSIIVSLPIEQIFHCNKLNLVTGSNFQKAGIADTEKQVRVIKALPKSLNFSPCNKVQEYPGECVQGVPHSDNRAKSISPHRTSEQSPKALKTVTKEERAKSVSPYCLLPQHPGPRLGMDKCKSSEDLSSLKEIHSSVCTDGVSHLLVRPVPTQYSSPRVPRSKLKIRPQLKKAHSEISEIGKIEMINEENSVVAETGTVLMDKMQDLSSNASCHDGQKLQSNSTPLASKETALRSGKRHKHSSSKKRLNKSNNSSVRVISSSVINTPQSLYRGTDSPRSGDSQNNCLQMNSSINQGKGRAGKKRTDVDAHSEGFKMKTHWLEMYGPVSPFSSVSSVTPDNKENY